MLWVPLLILFLLFFYFCCCCCCCCCCFLCIFPYYHWKDPAVTSVTSIHQMFVPAEIDYELCWLSGGQKNVVVSDQKDLVHFLGDESHFSIQVKNSAQDGAYDMRMTARIHAGEEEKEKTTSLSGSPRYGTKSGHFDTSIIHFPTSKGVSK